MQKLISSFILALSVFSAVGLTSLTAQAELQTALISGSVYDQKTNTKLSSEDIAKYNLKITASYQNQIASGEQSPVFGDLGRYFLRIPTAGTTQTVTLKISADTYKSQTVTIQLDYYKKQDFYLEKTASKPPIDIPVFQPIDLEEGGQTPDEQRQAYLTGYIYDQKSAKYLTYDQIIQSKVALTAEYYLGGAKTVQTATYNNQGKFFFTIPVVSGQSQQVQVKFESPAYQSQSMTLSLSDSRSITIVTQPVATQTAYISGYFYDQKLGRNLTAAEISAAAIQVSAQSTYALSPFSATLTSQGKYILSMPSTGEKQQVTVTFKSSLYKAQTFTVEVTDNRTRTIVVTQAVPVITLPGSY